MMGQMSQSRLLELTYSDHCQETTNGQGIATSVMDESMAHSRTQHIHGIGECMTRGRTEYVTCRPVVGTCTAAQANSNCPSAWHSTNRCGNRSPPATGVHIGHTDTHIAPD